MLELTGAARAAHDAARPGGPHDIPCHAPTTSMYFDQFGNVLPCCINTVRPMGTYPADRLADIWSGRNARDLRLALRSGDFSQGCHDCHSSISSGNFGAVNSTFDVVVAATDPDWVARHPPQADDGRDEWPRLLEFSLSSRCNLTCTMCSGYFSSSIRRAEGLAPFPEVYDEAFVDELTPFLRHATAVKFYGGEPFLAPINFEVLERIVEVNPGCRVSVTTNGTVWNEWVERILESLDVTVTVSIDAASTATYESIRLGADHATVLTNLDRFTAASRCSVDLTACAMRQNHRELPDLVQFANRRSLHLGINVVRYPQDHSLSSASTEELAEVASAWRSALEQLRTDATDDVSRWNVRNLENILAEVDGWLSAARDADDSRLDADEVGVTVMSAAPPARVRRRDWLDLLAVITTTPWPDGATRSEASFHEALDEQLRVLGSITPDPTDLAAAISKGIAAFAPESCADLDDRFTRFAAALVSPQLLRRVRLLADMPPSLIAQGVSEVAPEVIAERVAAFFPASGERRRRVSDQADPEGDSGSDGHPE
ncbi:MAG: radical SAM protein [Microthrixaceae bacterium]